MVTVFLICWGPYAVQSMAGVLGYVSWFVVITDHCDHPDLSLFSESSRGPLCVSSSIRQALRLGKPRHLRHHEQGGQ